MIRFRKYGGIAVLLMAVILAAQAGVSLLVRTHRMREYLIAHLESAFGRPVQAGRFSVQILPIPELDVDAVTIGEDPAFGNEYFLRADQMTARFRWLGLLRGHFEFGTMSFTRPSLILVSNADGHWNLEGWLPPARAARGPSAVTATQSRAESTYHLQKIDFDEGRINFQTRGREASICFHGCLRKRGAGFLRPLAVAIGGAAMAQWCAAAIHRHFASGGLCSRNVRSLATRANSFALGKSVARRLVPPDHRKRFRRARRICVGWKRQRGNGADGGNRRCQHLAIWIAGARARIFTAGI